MKVHEMDADIIGWCINYEQTSGKHLLSREGNTIPRCATNPTQLDLSQAQLDERSQACHLTKHCSWSCRYHHGCGQRAMNTSTFACQRHATPWMKRPATSSTRPMLPSCLGLTEALPHCGLLKEQKQLPRTCSGALANEM